MIACDLNPSASPSASTLRPHLLYLRLAVIQVAACYLWDFGIASWRISHHGLVKRSEHALALAPAHLALLPGSVSSSWELSAECPLELHLQWSGINRVLVRSLVSRLARHSESKTGQRGIRTQ